MDARLFAAVANTDVVNVSELCRQLGISRPTFYKWHNRYLTEGIDGLTAQSRRPHRNTYATSDDIDEQIRRLRKELDETGQDHGAATIQWHLEQQGCVPLPSTATIWRRLRDMGFVTPQPNKAPKRSWTRFEADRSNDRWQLDMTHWKLGNGANVEILNIVDDHSRLCVASRAAVTVTSVFVWDTFAQAAELLGLPAQTLTDNGLIFSGKLRNVEVLFEHALRHVGVRASVSSPFHPQTCGKVERFHQTLKKWLRAQPPALTLDRLQAQLDFHHLIYNHHRPHQSLGRRTPAQRFNASEPATASPAPLAARARTVVASHAVLSNGTINIGNARIHLGVAYAGVPVTTIRTGPHIVVLAHNQVIRSLELEPDRA